MNKWCRALALLLCFMGTSLPLMPEISLEILVVVPEFPKIHDVCMLNQIIGLIKRGHNVTIYAHRKGDTSKMQKEIIEYDLLSKVIINKRFPSRLHKYDIILFQLGHHAINVKKLYGYKGKVAVCLRGYDITGYIQKNRHAYDPLFFACDLFMPVCKAFERILQNLGCDPKKIRVIHSGINCSQFKFVDKKAPVNGEIQVLSVGRFVEKKGFEYAIMAFAELVKKYPKMRYTIIGNGPLKKSYMDLIRRLKLQNYITLHDWFAHDQYCEYLDKADILIAPSVTAADNDQEGIPNVIKEAMAKGVLVIGTTHSGIPELIEHQVSGLLVPERNKYAIVKAVDYLIRNMALWPEMRRKARKIITDHFDKEKVNDALEKALLKLL